MCEVLECESRELLEETQQIKKKMKDQEVMIEYLKKQIDGKQLQVNELTKKVENMGHAEGSGQQGQSSQESKWVKFRVLRT